MGLGAALTKEKLLARQYPGVDGWLSLPEIGWV